MAEEKHIPPEPGSAVDPADSGADAAIGGPNGEAAVEIGVSDIGVAELDQSSIDALFAGEEDGGEKEESAGEELSPPQPQPESEEKERGDAEPDAVEPEAGNDPGEDEKTEDIDQDQVIAEAEDMATEHDQDDIDQIFASLDDDNEPFIPDMEFAEEVGEEEVGELPDLDLEKEEPEDMAALDQGDDDSLNDPDQEPAPSTWWKSSPFLLFAGGACLLLLILLFSGLIFMIKKSDAPLPPSSSRELSANTSMAVEKDEEIRKAEAVNLAPRVGDINLTMPTDGGEVQVVFKGFDQDGDAITFKVGDLPAHGRLSGKMPSLVYLPNNNFPGEDSFTYTASDGRDNSLPARVIIRGPDLSQPVKTAPVAVARPRFIVPPVPVIAAMDIVIDGKSTRPVIIDPVVLWQMANRQAVPSRLFLKVGDSALRGKLKAGEDGRYTYRPDPYFRGQEIITYQLKSGGISSPPARIILHLASGHPGPRLKLSPLAPSVLVGETVLLDARQTKGEAGADLQFIWQQLAGPTVLFEQLTGDGSMVSFVVPSAYLRTGQDRLVLRVEVVDGYGKKDSREISTRIISRRQSPLWRMEP